MKTIPQMLLDLGQELLSDPEIADVYASVNEVFKRSCWNSDYLEFYIEKFEQAKQHGTPEELRKAQDLMRCATTLKRLSQNPSFNRFFTGLAGRVARLTLGGGS